MHWSNSPTLILLLSEQNSSWKTWYKILNSHKHSTYSRFKASSLRLKLKNWHNSHLSTFHDNLACVYCLLLSTKVMSRSLSEMLNLNTKLSFFSYNFRFNQDFSLGVLFLFKRSKAFQFQHRGNFLRALLLIIIIIIIISKL